MEIVSEAVDDIVEVCGSSDGLTLSHLPTDWIFWLDHTSLLTVAAVSVGAVQSGVDADAWRFLCAAELGVPASRLCLGGPVPEATGSKFQINAWRRVFYDLDIASTRNELRHTDEDYDYFPAVREERAEAPRDVEFSPDEAAMTVHCVMVGRAGDDRCVVAKQPLSPLYAATVVPKASQRPQRHSPPSQQQQRLRGEEKPDCTPDAFTWSVAYRTASYYEVTIGGQHRRPASAVDDSEGLRRHRPWGLTPCISVGVCTPRLTRNSVKFNQCGWDRESWGLHGDDGQIYHATSHGVDFAWLSPDSVRRGERLRYQLSARGTPRATFGEGDVVGCGVAYLLPYGSGGRLARRREQGPAEQDEAGRHVAPMPAEGLQAPAVVHASSPQRAERGIFFTRNGDFLGIAFLVDEDLIPPGVPLFPCVGIDAPWALSFNFGRAPFIFDLDAAIAPIEVRLAHAFQTLENHWPSSGGRTWLRDSRQAPTMRPLVSKFCARPSLGRWLTQAAMREAARYQANQLRPPGYEASESDGESSGVSIDDDSDESSAQDSDGHTEGLRRRRSAAGARGARGTPDGHAAPPITPMVRQTLLWPVPLPNFLRRAQAAEGTEPREPQEEVETRSIANGDSDGDFSSAVSSGDVALIEGGAEVFIIEGDDTGELPVNHAELVDVVDLED